MKNLDSAEYSFYSKMSLDKKSRIVTYLLAFLIGIGLPLAVGIINAFVSENNFFLLFPLPFLVIIYLTWLYAPTGVGITSGSLHIIRPIGPLVIPLEQIASVRPTADIKKEAGWIIRTWGSGGLWGWFGSFWSKKWGSFKLHLTGEANHVILELTNNSKDVVSPDDEDGFLAALRNQGVNVNE